MGADMLITCFTEPIDKSFKPDWNAGINKIKSYTSIPPEADHLGEELDDVKEALISSLNEVKECYEGSSRELVDIIVGSYRVYITGGMSWGDSPTEIYNDMSILNELGILDACGFNEDIDYKRILMKILSKKELLPMLMSIDSTFDQMISKALNKKKGKKK